MDIEENSPFQENIISEIYERLIFSRSSQSKWSYRYYKYYTMVFAKTDRYRLDFRNYKNESIERYTLTFDNKRNTGRIFEQPIF